jgi:hypothetical protein
MKNLAEVVPVPVEAVVKEQTTSFLAGGLRVSSYKTAVHSHREMCL